VNKLINEIDVFVSDRSSLWTSVIFQADN